MRTKSRPLIIKSHQWWEVGGQCEGEIEVGRGVRVCVCVFVNPMREGIAGC